MTLRITLFHVRNHQSELRIKLTPSSDEIVVELHALAFRVESQGWCFVLSPLLLDFQQV